jgi:hypothetical protein
MEAGTHLLHRRPDEPLIGIDREGVALNPEAEAALRQREAAKRNGKRSAPRKKKKAG